MKTICLLASFLIITIVPLCGMENNTSVIKKAIKFQKILDGLPEEIQHTIKIKKETYSLGNPTKKTTLIYPNFDCPLFCNNNNDTKQLNIWIIREKEKNDFLRKTCYIYHNTIIRKPLPSIWKKYYRKGFVFKKERPHNTKNPFFFSTNKNYSILFKRSRKRFEPHLNHCSNYLIFLKNNQQNITNINKYFPIVCTNDISQAGYFINSVSTSINGNLNLLSITQKNINSPACDYLRVWEFCSNDTKCKIEGHQHLSNKNQKSPRLISQCNNKQQTNTPITNILCLTNKVFIGIKAGKICIISIIPQKNHLFILQSIISKITNCCLHPSNYKIKLKTQILPKGFKIKQIAVDPNCRKQLIFVATTIIDNEEHTNLYHIFLDQLLMENGKYKFKKITELQDGVPDFIGFEGDNAIVAYTKKENNTISVVTRRFCLIKRWMEIANNIVLQRNKNLFDQCLSEIVNR